MTTYKPKKADELPGFIWFPGFADCIVTEYTLVDQIYSRLDLHSYEESAYYRAKWYKTEELAYRDLEKAFRDLSRSVELYYHNLPRDLQLDLFPKLKAIFETGDFIWRKNGDTTNKY